MKWLARFVVFVVSFFLGMVAYSITVPNGLSDCVVNLHDDTDSYVDASAVYAAVLSSSRFRNDRVLVITEKTNRGGTFMDEQIDAGHVPGADQDTIASYKTNNLTPGSLREALSKLPRVILWTEQDDETITRDDHYDMELFYKKHPKSRGLISLSKIGLNYRHDQALVYFSYYCGPLCAGGSFMILKKTGAHWRVTRKNELWVS